MRAEIEKGELILPPRQKHLDGLGRGGLSAVVGTYENRNIPSQLNVNVAQSAVILKFV
jgi:hypothetical protein